MPSNYAAAIDTAKRMLHGAVIPPAEVLEAAHVLIGQGNFGLARSILSRVRDSKVADWELSAKLGVLHAIAMCRDSDLPVELRIAAALEILEGVEPTENTREEKLAVTGNIYRYCWRILGRRRDLELAARYYEESWQTWHRYGSGAAAASAIDLLSEAEEGQSDSESTEPNQKLRIKAEALRREVVERYQLQKGPPEMESEWSVFSGLGEAAFGLRQYADAREWLVKGARLPIPEWMRESKARDLVMLLRHQVGKNATREELEQSEGWSALRDFVDACHGDMDGLLLGKVGLVLWGGGLRAALFHLGVLARLAEADLLRKVEFLSCASGGAIVGTLFYLEARGLLAAKPDREIGREDYVKLVQRVEERFLNAVQRDLRNRTLMNPLVHLRTIVDPSYTRTERLAELLEREVFCVDGDPKRKGPLYLNELNMRPDGEKDDFDPERDNWKRQTKAPILVLNATTLNTGGSWQFTVKWMGEPQQHHVTNEVGGADRLKRVYYSEAPEKYRQMRLGRAVAASVCLAGLFEPVELPGLYPDLRVQLIDGSVYNRAGVTGMLEAGCSVMLVSDASSQLSTELKPRRGILAMAGRLSQILLERLRQSEMQNLLAWRRSPAVSQVVLVHSRKGLGSREVSAMGEIAPKYNEPGFGAGPYTPYGIRREIQEKISEIRTDLDAFSDIEAYALMTSGYRIMDHELGRWGYVAPDQVRIQKPWRFLVLEEVMTRRQEGAESGRLIKILSVARYSLFRMIRLSPAAAIIGWLVVLAIVAFVGLPALLRNLAVLGSVPLGSLGWKILGGLAGFLACGAINRKGFPQTLFALFMGLVGWIVPLFQVFHSDAVYLRWGRARRYELDVNFVQKLRQPPTAPEINNLLDRSEAVDAVRRLLELAEFKVELFPRDPARNPLQFNVDLFAGKAQKALVVVVKTRDDSPAGVDWTAGSALQTAAWGVAAQQKPSREVQPLMVLAETRRDASLDELSNQVGIAILEVTRDEIQTIRNNDVSRIHDLLRRLNEALETGSQKAGAGRSGGSLG